IRTLSLIPSVFLSFSVPASARRYINTLSYTTLFRSQPEDRSAGRHTAQIRPAFQAGEGIARACQRRGEALIRAHAAAGQDTGGRDRKSTRLNSSHVSISYAVFC